MFAVKIETGVGVLEKSNNLRQDAPKVVPPHRVPAFPCSFVVVNSPVHVDLPSPSLLHRLHALRTFLWSSVGFAVWLPFCQTRCRQKWGLLYFPLIINQDMHMKRKRNTCCIQLGVSKCRIVDSEKHYLLDKPQQPLLLFCLYFVFKGVQSLFHRITAVFLTLRNFWRLCGRQ